MRITLVGGPQHGKRFSIDPSNPPGSIVFPKYNGSQAFWVGPFEPFNPADFSDLTYQRIGDSLEELYYKYKKEVTMEKEIESLIVIFNSMRGKGLGNGTPIKVQQRIPSGGGGDVFCLIGIDSDGKTAYGYYEERPGSLIRRTADKEQWYRYVAPEPIAHWPAIVIKKPKSSYADYGITQTLYTNAEIARDSLGDRFVRLATEYPAIMLVPRN